MTQDLKLTSRRTCCAYLLGGALAPAWVAGPASANANTSALALRFAVLGDAEPKPEPRFPHLAGAVEQINRMAAQGRMDFVVGVGDIAHKGTVIQYEGATAVLQRLTRPFYPIMGNEEHGSTVERFLAYAERWNHGRIPFPKASYVLEPGPLVLLFVSPDHGRDFSDSGVAWMRDQVQRHSMQPVMLVVHAAPKGVFPENPDKGAGHPGFADMLRSPNVVAVISGDLHMDMDRVVHSKRVGRVHHLHAPGLERTKLPDETRHTGQFRVFSVTQGKEVVVDTFAVGSEQPLDRHRYRFALM
jgi:hypothetical protein